jgi:hypothetical protein
LRDRLSRAPNRSSACGRGGHRLRGGRFACIESVGHPSYCFSRLLHGGIARSAKGRHARTSALPDPHPSHLSAISRTQPSAAARHAVHAALAAASVFASLQTWDSAARRTSTGSPWRQSRASPGSAAVRACAHIWRATAWLSMGAIARGRGRGGAASARMRHYWDAHTVQAAAPLGKHCVPSRGSGHPETL